MVRGRACVESIINDLLIGVWFAVGSFCCFYGGAVLTLGVWLAVIGSVQLLMRPLIRLHRYVRFRRLPDASQDY